jgi:hypothetical protein
MHALLLLALLSADFKQLEFLLGKWIGVETNKAESGAFSFEPQLNNKIIVRRNSAPNHEDLLVIYIEDETRAVYFDNEGHVIHYKVSVPSENRAVFESDGAPKYRLTYWLNHDSLNGKFEVADKTYLNWTSTRKK